MASGKIPIGASVMTADAPVMKVAELKTTVTKVCYCDAATITDEGCTCTAEFANLPTSEVYALSASVQCNAATKIDSIKVGEVMKGEEMELPEVCVDNCMEYHKLLNSASVQASGGSVAVEIKASGIKADHCGAGHYLKVVLSLQIGEEQPQQEQPQ
eukprot:1536406-Rhodomonas_salina.1